jgi:hypothetical protein
MCEATSSLDDEKERVKIESLLQNMTFIKEAATFSLQN